MSKPKGAMVGFSENWEPFVVANVTTDEAQKFAAVKKLPSFQLFPNHDPGQSDRGMIHLTYSHPCSGNGNAGIQPQLNRSKALFTLVPRLTVTLTVIGLGSVR